MVLEQSVFWEQSAKGYELQHSWILVPRCVCFPSFADDHSKLSEVDLESFSDKLDGQNDPRSLCKCGRR